MGKTLNLTDKEALVVHRLLENELQHQAAAKHSDEVYTEQLKRIMDKIQDST